MRNFKEMNKIKNAKAEIFHDTIYTAIKKHLGGENSISSAECRRAEQLCGDPYRNNGVGVRQPGKT